MLVRFRGQMNCDTGVWAVFPSWHSIRLSALPWAEPDSHPSSGSGPNTSGLLMSFLRPALIHKQTRCQGVCRLQYEAVFTGCVQHLHSQKCKHANIPRSGGFYFFNFNFSFLMTTDSLVHSLPQKKQTFACSAAGSGGKQTHTPPHLMICVWQKL